MSLNKVRLSQVNWDDLEKECPKCHGRGKDWTREFGQQVTQTRNTQNISQNEAFEQVKKGWTGETHEKCSRCDGKGTVPSEEGQKLLDFVKKYLG